MQIRTPVTTGLPACGADGHAHGWTMNFGYARAMLSAVLFDLDETLFDRTASLAAFLRVQHARFAGRLGAAPFAVWRDRFLSLDARGHTHKSVVYRSLLEEFQGDATAAHVPLEDYNERCWHQARPLAGAIETLRALRGRGMRLGIVTNGETAFQMRHIDALALRDQVETILISQAEGLRKPDAALFRRAATALGLEAGQCLFVGDNPAVDILGAHGAGMRTAWLRRDMPWPAEIAPNPGPAIETLAQVLDLVDRSS